MIKKAENIDQYISTFPESTQKLLELIRSTIHKAAPEAQETISYAIPTFTLNGNLVHFAGYQHHIGFYPGAAGIATFKDALSIYKNAKGSVQFPLDKPMPLELITKIVAFRVEQNLAKTKKRTKQESGFLNLISAPARRALENAGINNLQKLSQYNENEVLKLHGVGPASIPILRNALAEIGLTFKKKQL
jgi:uncharacterized protein YdhG (YjbR/CyaY superfamily)